MTDIYEEHRKTFQQVAAFAVLQDGSCVATIAFKYPRDGAGRLRAFVHWIDVRMVKGWAGGGGYDKHTAALQSAVDSDSFNAAITEYTTRYGDDADLPSLQAFQTALAANNGHCWDAKLRKAGFEVIQAV